VLKALPTIGLLLLSNVFMNLAWYGHLKNKEIPLWTAIFASWGIAFFEYCLQVPANRMGSEHFSVTQLKIIQEVLSIGTFVVIASVMFRERPTMNQWISFGLIVLAAFFAVKK